MQWLKGLAACEALEAAEESQIELRKTEQQYPLPVYEEQALITAIL